MFYSQKLLFLKYLIFLIPKSDRFIFILLKYGKRNCKIFRTKKRDLSNQSNDGDDSKKQKPSLTDSSSMDDEANNVVFDDPHLFEEGLNSPRCVGILYKCLKNLDTQVKAIHQLGLSNEENQIKGTKHLEAATTSIDEIYKKFEDYEKERKEKDEEIKNLKAGEFEDTN